MATKFDYLEFYCAQLSPETAEHLPCKFNPGIDQAKIHQLEQQAGIVVPDELKEFYEFSYGARLSEYQILTIPEIVDTLLEIESTYDGLNRPILPFAIVLGVGDYVAFDLEQNQDGKPLILDGFHEFDPSDWEGICFGFMKWLRRLAQNIYQPFWLTDNPDEPQ